MKLKRRLWLCYIFFFTFLFKRKKLGHTVHFNFSATPEASHAEAIDIVTVAFNNETWIEYQIKLIRKYIHDKHVTFIVADNSSNPEKRKSISALCRKYNTGYISVPKNMIAKHPGGSYAHGTTLNWIYSNVIRLRKPDIFGFLDHDFISHRTCLHPGKIGRQRLLRLTPGRGVLVALGRAMLFPFRQSKSAPSRLHSLHRA